MPQCRVFHYHKAASKAGVGFQNVEVRCSTTIWPVLLGLGSSPGLDNLLQCVPAPTQLMDCHRRWGPSVASCKVIASVAGHPPAAMNCINQDLIAQLLPGFGAGLAPFFTGNWAAYKAISSTFKGELNPGTGSLWMTEHRPSPPGDRVLSSLPATVPAPTWGIGHSPEGDP